MEFRRQHGYDVEAASDAAVVVNDKPSLTVQSMAEDADLNVLMERMKVTGRFPDNPRVPMYGDFSDVTDFQSALNAIRAAEDAFMEFPAKVRARFENNPQKLLEFVADDGNIDEARSLGLLKEKAVGVSAGRSSGAGAGAGSASGGAGAPVEGAAAASRVQPGGGQAASGAGVGSGSGAS